MRFFRFKELKRKKKTPSAKLCPNCKKPELQRTTLGSFTNTEFYKCKNCNYQGSLYLEIDLDGNEEDNAFLETLKKKFPEYVEDEP